MLSRRNLLLAAVATGVAPRLAHAAASPKEIRVDWATYNPVSMVLKEQGLLEKEFGSEGIAIRWVQTLGSNKALEFLNAGSIDFGSTAGAAALIGQDQRQSDQIDLCVFSPRMDCAGDAQGHGDQQDRGS